jgi:hypothetical protein
MLKSPGLISRCSLTGCQMDDVEALSTIVGILKQLEPEIQKRVLQSVNTFLGFTSLADRSPQSNTHTSPSAGGAGDFSRDRTISAKGFLHDKRPATDIERVVCLAYYLAHYRDTPHFKTVDISALNTEAAQPKFSNASVAVDNARAAGYLVPATKGNKQISAVGEKFVELLPDREAAREVVKSFRPRRSKKAKEE